MTKSPFLSLAFRPMFLAAGFAAFLLPALWISFFTGKTTYFATGISLLDWHAYSMYAGFGYALVAGFLLTASANWSGKPAKAGLPLLLLLIFWWAEQVVLLIPGMAPGVSAAAALPVPLLFLVLLWLQLKDNPRNRNIFIPWAGLFVTAKLLFLAGLLAGAPEAVGLAKLTFLGSLRILVVVITGRIIPFFMERRIGARPQVPDWVEQSSILSVCLLLVVDLMQLSAFPVAAVYGLALLTNTLRLYYFKPGAAIKVPILFILHLGYLWLLIHLAFKLISVELPEFESAGLSCIYRRLFGVFAIGMMTRVALGHTGRFIEADGWIKFMYFCVLLGAVMRVFVPVVFPGWYMKSLHHSSGWWSLGFLVYLIRFTPILIKPRADAKPS